MAYFLAPATNAGAAVGKGTLTCPSGTTLSGGQCTAPATAVCPAGSTQNGNTCTSAPQCPAGQRLFSIPVPGITGQFCATVGPGGFPALPASTPTCPSGTTAQGGGFPIGFGITTVGSCAGPTQAACPAGTTQQGNTCTSTPTRVCPSGESAIPEDPKFCAPNENLAFNQEIRDEALGDGGAADGSFTPDGGSGFNVDNFVPGNGGSIDNFLPGGG